MRNFTAVIATIFCFFSLSVFGQGASAGINENLWTSGKIFVVISVLSTILIGIFVMLFYLERKISRLEKKVLN